VVDVPPNALLLPPIAGVPAALLPALLDLPAVGLSSLGSGSVATAQAAVSDRSQVASVTVREKAERMLDDMGGPRLLLEVARAAGPRRCTPKIDQTFQRNR
jgi:hypothetical protein